MIYEALLVPSESPPTLREIKRALLTYDKLILIDPSDRGLIPNESFMSAMFPMFPPGVVPIQDVGPIRPMGKSIAYDEKFVKTLEACAPAKELIEVRSTYKAQELKKTPAGVLSIKLGFGGTYGYPLDPASVYWLYRDFASNQELLHGAIGHAGVQDVLAELALNPEMAITEAMGDGVINDARELPAIKLPEHVDFQLMKQLSHIARARLGSFIKYTGYCEAKALVPVFPERVYGGVASKLVVATQDMLSKVIDPFWIKRNRVLDFAYEEYLNEASLDQLSMDEVVQLRTTAWGRQGEAREQLVESIFTIANELEDAEKFDVEAKKQIKEFYKQSAALLTERKKFNAGIRASIYEGTLLFAGSAQANALAQGLLPVGSNWLAMVLGGIGIGVWGVRKWEKYDPQLTQLRANEEMMKRGAGIGLHNFFSKIPK